MYWHKYNDGRRNGGLWRCRIRKRQMDAATIQRRRDRDPIFRIEEALRHRRREALKRRRERQLKGA